MSAYGTLRNILQVVYAPHKAFKEISQNPKYMGPILIMILFVVGNVGFYYTILSKTYVEQTLPTGEQRDIWTENSTLWKGGSGVAIIDNYVDYINGTYYGNRSLEFSIVNSRQISMELNGIGPVDCSGPDGYKNLYFRINWSSPEVKPENVTIYLFSATPLDYFYYNIADNFPNSTINIWNNVTIPLENEGWSNNSITANWSNITGLRLEFLWPNDSNITLLVDGLFFRGIFKSQIEIFGSGVLTTLMLNYFMQFVIQWVILSGLLYIMTRAFKAKTVWRTLLICVGFALVTLFIQALLTAAASTSLSTLYYPLELIGGVEGEFENAANKLWEQTWIVIEFSRYLQMTVYIWTVGLCAIATRLLTEFSWLKSLLVSTASFLVSILAVGFLV